MKIISKYKDFYDYLVQDPEPDLNYVRNIDIVNKYWDELFKRKDNSIHYFSKYYGYKNYIYGAGNGILTFDNIVFGIYPFVYSQPILKIYYKNKFNNSIQDTYIILSKDLVDNLLLKSNEAYSKLLNIAQEKFDHLVEENICEYTKVKFNLINTFDNIIKALKLYVWKVKCEDVFYKIKSPIFIKYYEDLFINSVYWNFISQELPKQKYIHYIINISFQKLNQNILKYWYDELNNINTYNNIENFLWSIKQEPIANPDNKTKILSHGFDLKTSFRKM